MQSKLPPIQTTPSQDSSFSQANPFKYAATPSSQASTPSSSYKPTFIRQLPQYYPKTLHDYNLAMSKIPQIAKASNFLDIPPLFLCFAVLSIFFILIFAKLLVNMVIILALFLSSAYNCLFLTAASDQVVFSQVLNVTLSLAFLAGYLFISPLIDTCLDWVPFYHPIKLFIAFSLTYHADHSNSTSSTQTNRFPLVGLDENGREVNLTNDSQGYELNSPLMYTYSHVQQVPALPQVIKAIIDLLQACIMLGKVWVLRKVRQTVWRVRMTAYNIHITCTNADLVDDGSNNDNNGNFDSIDHLSPKRHKPLQDELNIDEVLQEYAIDDFNSVPPHQE